MQGFPRSWPKAAAHPPRYRWHKYWGRKPHNLVAAVIGEHLPTPGAMLDLFCGSGIAAAEALILGHRAVALDLNPVATGILVQTMAAPELDEVDAAMARLSERCAGRIEALYRTRCRGCQQPVQLDCAIWRDQALEALRYRCPHCERRALDELPEAADVTLAGCDAGARLPAWPLRHANGQPFQESQGAEAVAALFTPRARLAISWLLEAIEDEPARLQPTLRLILTSMIHLASRLCPVPKPSPTNHATPFSSFWAQHSYNQPSLAMEQPVWRKFHAAYWGHQGWRKAQFDARQQQAPFTSAIDARDWLAGNGALWAATGPALTNLQALAELADEPCFDLLFADPPYGSAIQYGELSALWNAFLASVGEEAYRERLLADEVVVNRAQGKDLAGFRDQLRAHFAAARPLLKPGAKAVVTFHSPKGAVRHAAIGAIVAAGYQLVEIHHDGGARRSSKSCQQPFGSVEGDFWLQFVPAAPATVAGAVDWERMVLTEACTALKEADEPLPFTELINRLEPRLATVGFFAAPVAPVAVDEVLKAGLGHTLALSRGEVAGVPGWLWALADSESNR